MRPSRIIQIVMVLALVVSIAFIAHQRNELLALRSELATQREIQTNEVLTPPAAQKDDSAQIAELARLRNQVTQLRRAAAEASNDISRLRSDLVRSRVQVSTTTSHQPVVPSGQAIEPGKGVGGVRLGMTHEELTRELGSPASVFGADDDGLSALAYPAQGFNVVVSNAAVIGLQLRETFTGRTKEGIGMGSTAAEVVAAFGSPGETEQYNDGSHVYIYPERGIKLLVGAGGKVRYATVRAVR